MRGGASVWSRTRRLELDSNTASLAALRAVAERVAAACGVSPEEILAEAGVLTGRCRAAGATTPRAMADLVAAEHGLDPEEVWAEAGRLAAEMTGAER